jgi:hypothetical protein
MQGAAGFKILHWGSRNKCHCLDLSRKIAGPARRNVSVFKLLVPKVLKILAAGKRDEIW